LFIFLGGFMNKDSILALLRQNPKLAEAKSLPDTHKIADEYLNQVAGGQVLCTSSFSRTTNADGSTSSTFGRGCP
jgi:hypothetical protein